jgi:peptide/nickel transport system permease protein
MGRTFAVLGHSLPGFWLGIVAILIFAVWFELLPAGTMGLHGVSWKNFVLPVAVLAWLPMAGYVRLVRSSMLEILDAGYITLARAKGLSERVIIWKHGLRNAIIAPLTFGGLLLANLVRGSVAVETVFAWPGIARWGVQAVWANNFNVLVLVTLVFTLGYVVMAVLVDILYGIVDPRIRYT